jgi:hypothetical protein
MDNTSQVQDWESFISLLSHKGETALVSMLYRCVAEENGQEFENLPDLVRDISTICKLDLNEETIERIWLTAPLLFAE